MTVKIQKLTPEQEAQLPQFVEYGLRHGLSTEPCDRPKGEAAIRAHYTALGREEPRLIIWLDSPDQGAIGAAILAGTKFSGDQVWDQVGAQVWDQVWDQVRNQVWDQVWAQVGDQVGAQVGDQVRAQVRAQVGAQVWDQVWAQVWAQVRAQVGAQVRAQVYRAAYGSHDMGFISWYRTMQAFGVTLSASADTIAAVSENVGWWWPFEHAVIATERPRIIRFDDEKRLHCETGPAVEYADGFRVSVWHGQRIPDAWVTGSPPSASEALHWPNMDQRAAACEIVGWHNILDQLSAKIIDDSGDPVWGRLVEVDLPDSGHERFLDALCGTGRRFALPVPPKTRSVDEAQSVLHGGLPPEILKFAVERT